MIKRKISLWVKGTQNINEFIITTDCGTQKHLIDNAQHYNFIIEFVDPKNLKIECISGQVDLGSVNINYSWIINPYYQKHFSNDVRTLLNTQFDLKDCSLEFIESLKEHSLWIDSGADGYSAAEELVIGPKLNLMPAIKNNGWFEITAGNYLMFDLYVPIPANDYANQNQVLYQESTNQKIETTHLRLYDHAQIDNITKQFQLYVERHYADPLRQWTDIPDPSPPLPYSEKIRIQSQLIDNLDLIRGRRLVDFGCDRGQYLYPSVLLGANHVTGAQIVKKYNNGINAALQHMNLGDRACAVDCDVYDLDRVKEILNTGIDTILFLGIIYHINHHYQLLKTFTDSSATAIVIDSRIYCLDFYLNPDPLVQWGEEQQNEIGSGVEILAANSKVTWTGKPNASWIWNTLVKLGWTPRSSVITNSLALNYPQFRTRGVITATR